VPTKHNPFTPDKLAPPKLFAGRKQEIADIDDCLRETKDGNPHHFLIEGEAGIGKSSLLARQAGVAMGEVGTQDGERLDFVVVSLALHDQDSYVSLIRKIAGELKKQLSRRQAMKTLVLQTLQFLSRFEVQGLRYNHEISKDDESQLLEHLQSDFVSVLSGKRNDFDGIALLFDEADKPPPEARLGLVCKLLTEEMSRKRCDYLCLGLAGLPGILEQLKAGHAAVPRLFERLELKPLLHDECIGVIRKGLAEVYEEHGLEVAITEDAAAEIARLSEGYPYFLQVFAHAAYREDTDRLIDGDDVSRSLSRKNGPYQKLGAKFFEHVYLADNAPDYRGVLFAMADHPRSWMERGAIIAASRLKESTVDNALRAFKERGTILQHEKRRGLYRLPTQAFAVWIKGKWTNG